MPMAKPRLIDGNMFGAPIDGEVVLERHTFVRAGFSVASLPPGEIELHIASAKACIEVHADGPPGRYGVNSDRIQSYEPQPGSVFYLPAGTGFRLQCINTKRNLILHFDPCRIDELVGDRMIGAGTRDRPLLWEQHAEIGALASLTSGHLNAGSGINRLYVESLATAILALTFTIAGGGHAVARSARGLDQRMARVCDYIEAHLGEKLELAEMAAVACLSPFHFLRSFKAIIGDTPHQYVVRRRVERAKAMIVGSQLPLADVAYAVGFSSQAHMTSAFKAAYGTTPAKFRANG